jgi:uncharacterized membrane protein
MKEGMHATKEKTRKRNQETCKEELQEERLRILLERDFGFFLVLLKHSKLYKGQKKHILIDSHWGIVS